MNTIVGSIFVLTALLMGGGAFLHHHREARARRWPFVEGEVVDSSLVQDGLSAHGTPRVRYRYRVGDLIYESERLSMSLAYESARAARRMLRRHPRGQRVKVYFDPADPSSAVVERPLTPEWLVFIAISALFLVLGTLLLAGHTR